MISGYDTELYRDILSKWERRENTSYSQVCSKKKAVIADHSLIVGSRYGQKPFKSSSAFRTYLHTALELIKRFNFENVLIYCDPPYVLETRHIPRCRHRKPCALLRCQYPMRNTVQCLDNPAVMGKIMQAAERLRGVQIENRPALELIKRFNFENGVI